MTNRKLTEFQEAWLTALESGNYSQDRQFLRTDKGFCCLGVACDISTKGKWDNNFGNYSYMTKENTLPARVSDKLDLNFTGENNCAVMNDVEKLSFANIAARIRANPENYFLTS